MTDNRIEDVTISIEQIPEILSPRSYILRNMFWAAACILAVAFFAIMVMFNGLGFFQNQWSFVVIVMDIGIVYFLWLGIGAILSLVAAYKQYGFRRDMDSAVLEDEDVRRIAAFVEGAHLDSEWIEARAMFAGPVTYKNATALLEAAVNLKNGKAVSVKQDELAQLRAKYNM